MANKASDNEGTLPSQSVKNASSIQVLEQHRIHGIKNTNMNLESKILIQYQWIVILTQLIQQQNSGHIG